MPLQGSLSHLSLAEVLQTSLSGRRWGNLVLRRGADRAVLHVAEEGLYLIEPDVMDPEDVLQSFVARGAVQVADVEEARSAHSEPLALLDHFVDRGSIPQGELVELLGAASEDAIVDLLSWKDGEFRFEEGASPATAIGPAGRVAIDAGSLLLRAAQRIDERTAVAQALGLRAVLFRALTPHPPPPRTEDDPAPMVHGCLDGTALVDEVALRVGTSRFQTLKAVLDLVQAHAARPATVDEISAAVKERLEAKQPRAARALLFQWAESLPDDLEPYQQMAEIASTRGRTDEEADARTALGQLLLRAGKGREAVDAFARVLTLRPGDRAAVAGRREAALASGNDALFRAATAELAKAALDEEDAEKAAALLGEIAAADLDLSFRLLRARAFVRLKDRVALIAEVEAIAGMIGTRCRKRQEREAAGFCRDAVASLAPERSDLLRKFRALAEGGSLRSKRWALVTALLLVVATGGYLLKPPGPGGLLEKAKSAIESGDRVTANEMITKLVDEYPESAEAQEAFRLQNALTPRSSSTAQTTPVDPALKKEVEGAMPGWLASMKSLPNITGRKALTALVAALERPEAAGMRPTVLAQVQPHVLEAVRVLSFEARSRADSIARTRQLASSGRRAKPDALRELVAEVRTYREDTYPADLASTQQLLGHLVALQPEDVLRKAARDLDVASKTLSNAIASHARDYDECRKLIAEFDVESDYEACRGEAPKLLVAGRIDEADAIYQRLQDRLVACEKDPVLRPVADAARKREMPQFLRERRSVIEEIHRGLDAAATAERAGDLAGAGQAYAALAKRFWMIRFENLVTVPLLVETIPPGSHVHVNGADAGISPVTIRYGWASQTTLTLESPGFEATSEQVRTGEVNPRGRIVVRLKPRLRWSAAVDPTLVSRPVPVEEHVIASDRGGRVTLFDGDDGKVIWTRQLKSLEGVRSRPAVSGAVVYVPFVDGRLHLLDLKDGAILGQEDIGRPVGDADTWDGAVAVATVARSVVIYRDRRKAFEVALSGDASAGVLAAHGAFWVGTTAGHVDRIDATSHQLSTTRPERARAQVLAIAATPTGVLATTGDGMLVAIDKSGKVLWSTEALGDLVGTPAQTGEVAAAVDRQGRVLLFDATRGSPKGQTTMDGEPIGGLIAVQGLLVASLTDGRIWVHDAVTGRRMAEAPLGADGAKFQAADLGEGRIAVPSKGSMMSVLDLSVLSASEQPTDR